MDTLKKKRKKGGGRKSTLGEGARQIAISVSLAQLIALDQARGKQTRSSWLRDLIEEKLRS